MSTLQVIFLCAAAGFGALSLVVSVAHGVVGFVVFLPQVALLGYMGIRRHA
jgi:hypothetical protein